MATSEDILEKEVPVEIQKVLDSAKNKNNKGNPVVEKPAEEQKPAEEKPVEKPSEEVNTDDLLATLQKIKGFENIKSLDDLKTPEKKEVKVVDDAEKAIAKKAEIKKWAVERKVVDQKIIDEYEQDSTLSNIEKAFRAYQEERKNDIDELTDEPYTEEALRSEFEDENYLFADEDDPKYKRAMNKINLIADTWMHDKYKPLVKLESEYDSNVSQLENQNILNTAISNSIPEIIKDGLSYAITDDKGVQLEVKIPVTKKALEEISISLSELQDLSNPQEVKATLATKYVLKNIDKIVHEVATAYHSQKILGKIANSKGIEARKSEFESKTGDVPPEIQEVLDKAKNKKKY